MTNLGQQALRLALSLVAAALLLQWTWQLVKPLLPLFVVAVVIWVTIRVVRARRQDW